MEASTIDIEMVETELPQFIGPESGEERCGGEQGVGWGARIQQALALLLGEGPPGRPGRGMEWTQVFQGIGGEIRTSRTPGIEARQGIAVVLDGLPAHPLLSACLDDTLDTGEYPKTIS